ncbi:MAG: hypothetical protein ACTSR3_01330 [Candidatus Helarchaeota archaeon]
MNTFYIDEFYNIIDKPNPIKIGMDLSEPFFDCEYLLNVNQHNRPYLKNKKLQFHEKFCPNGSDYTSDCPIFIGNNPCSKAIKCKLIMVTYRYKPRKLKQKKLPI